MGAVFDLFGYNISRSANEAYEDKQPPCKRKIVGSNPTIGSERINKNENI